MTGSAPRHAARQHLLRWMSGALAAVEPSHRVAAALRDFPGERVAVLALGKAAAGMANGAHSALAGRIERTLVIGPEAAREDLASDHPFHAGNHPLPGSDSLAAGILLETWLRELDPGMPLLVLLSGGGSALAELPVEGMTPADLEALNRWLLSGGLDIAVINRIRARFSRLKRGGLLRLAGAREVTGLVVSDVPGDRIEDVASGPLSPLPHDWPDILVPDWLRALHENLPLPPRHLPAANADLRIVARNVDALDAVARFAQEDNASVNGRENLSGDAEAAGIDIARRLLAAPPGVSLFGGETTVRLPASPGRGGRNQQLALAAASEIAGRDDVLLLAFGTDGIDGNSEDAGALVDGGTAGRIRDAGLDLAACLAGANSNPALAAAGDVIHTGPSGTNVADIVIGLKTERT